jgi:peptidoglycan/xylan/chitin deacetylase (PgdA/CDA1 family)
MKRWIQHPLHHIKRGLASLFVCAVALLPVISVAQSMHLFGGGSDPRKATALPAFQERPVDATTVAPRLFGQPLITVTFDDGWESVYTVAMPQLNKHGIATTQFIISGTDKETTYMSDDQIATIGQDGHELDAHTVTHPDLTTLSDEELTVELQQSQQALRQRFNTPAEDFASPYGHTDARTIGFIQEYYRSHRNTAGDYRAVPTNVNLPQNFDRYNIIGVTVRRDTTVADLKRLVDYAKATNGWLVLTYHQVDDGPSDFGLDPDALDKQFAYLGSTDVRIVTMGQVLDTVAPTHLPEF